MVDKISGIGPLGVADISGQIDRADRTGESGRVPRTGTIGQTGATFDQILQQQLTPVSPGAAEALGVAWNGSVRFSAHAQQRLAQAAVQLGPQALAKLEAAVDKAGQKGGKESLILLDDLAFVVSVKNRTVITAVGADRMAGSVFTKIDSVVIARGLDAGDASGEAAASGVIEAA
ncbi:MAG: hypothetical protein HY332_23315 [Chloroflexi bacterium]|nr:hypothetical protein [Chloroflexota bacterium]